MCLCTSVNQSCTWKLLGPSDHVDQLPISHAGEQCHHGDLGVRSAQLLARAQNGGFCTLEQEEHLWRQQVNSDTINLFETWDVALKDSVLLLLIFPQQLRLYSSTYLVRRHADNWWFSSSDTAAVFPPALRGHCSLLPVLRALVLITHTSPSFVTPQNTPPVLTHTLTTKRFNIKHCAGWNNKSNKFESTRITLNSLGLYLWLTHGFIPKVQQWRL